MKNLNIYWTFLSVSKMAKQTEPMFCEQESLMAYRIKLKKVYPEKISTFNIF